MPHMINGFGTTFYGQRDFKPDGSYVTTEWIVCWFIPILPLRSLRVIPWGFRPRVAPSAYGGFADEYLVIQESLPNLKQVVCTYALMVVVFVGLLLLFAQVLTGSYFDVALGGSVLASARFAPRFLRTWACKRMGLDYREICSLHNMLRAMGMLSEVGVLASTFKENDANQNAHGTMRMFHKKNFEK